MITDLQSSEIKNLQFEVMVDIIQLRLSYWVSWYFWGLLLRYRF